MQTDMRRCLIEPHRRYATVLRVELCPGMRKDDEPLDPERWTSKQARQLGPQAIAHREDVALDLRRGIADVSRVRRAGSAKPGPPPATVRLAHDPPSHGFGFEQEDAVWSDHQVIDVAGAAR